VNQPEGLDDNHGDADPGLQRFILFYKYRYPAFKETTLSSG
jgi:hypothetical protein